MHPTPCRGSIFQDFGYFSGTHCVLAYDALAYYVLAYYCLACYVFAFYVLVHGILVPTRIEVSVDFTNLAH